MSIVMNLSLWSIFLIFFKLGMTSFGGPIAQLERFHKDFVKQRKWISEKDYGEIIAICQSLPGPASGKLAIIMGMLKKDMIGGLIAIIGFVLPATIIFICIAYAVAYIDEQKLNDVLYWLQIIIVAVIFQAVIKMIKRFCFDTRRFMIMLVCAAINLLQVGTIAQVVSIFIGIILGQFIKKIPDTNSQTNHINIDINYKIPLALFMLILIGLNVSVLFFKSSLLQLFNIFYFTGSLVFGGGHIILPILQHQILPTGLVDKNAFMLGYGLAQAMPGPLFSFASYVGTLVNINSYSWLIGLMGLFAVYLPSYLLILVAFPLWKKWRHVDFLQLALQGINAAVTGLLLAAFYNPIFKDAIYSYKEVIYAVVVFISLEFLKLPQWLVVGVGIAIGIFW